MEKREEKISFTLKSHPPLVLAEKEKKGGGRSYKYVRQEYNLPHNVGFDKYQFLNGKQRTCFCLDTTMV